VNQACGEYFRITSANQAATSHIAISDRAYLVQRWWEIILSITLHFPDDTRRFNSSNQFSTTLICGLLSFVIIKKRWPSGDTS
jgi:hypothetical protein